MKVSFNIADVLLLAGFTTVIDGIGNYFFGNYNPNYLVFMLVGFLVIGLSFLIRKKKGKHE